MQLAAMDRRVHFFRAREKVLELGQRTRIMGVVNVTPDSFSDGGRFLDRSHAVDRCLELVEQGADIIDIGGESTRPGGQPIAESVELDRILPVLGDVVGNVTALISVDTYKAGVAREALEAGADIINNVGAFRLDSAMAPAVADHQAGIILMHSRGTPATMQHLPPSPDILAEIQQDLRAALQTACAHQIPRDRIVLDPGIGFGKTAADNLSILNRLSFLREFEVPILVGTSRKRFLGTVLGLTVDQDWKGEEVFLGTATSIVMAIARGAHIVRVHDVREIKQVVQTADAILAERQLT